LRKKWVIVIAIVLSIAIISKFVYEQIEFKTYKNSILMQITIYATGSYNDSYCFIVTTDNTLHAMFGKRKNNDIRTIPFLSHIDEENEKYLTDDEVNLLLTLSNSISNTYTESSKEYSIATDSWSIGVLYQGKTVLCNYYLAQNADLRELVDKTIELSPIPVVLLYGSTRYLYFNSDMSPRLRETPSTGNK